MESACTRRHVNWRLPVHLSETTSIYHIFCFFCAIGFFTIYSAKLKEAKVLTVRSEIIETEQYQLLLGELILRKVTGVRVICFISTTAEAL